MKFRNKCESGRLIAYLCGCRLWAEHSDKKSAGGFITFLNKSSGSWTRKKQKCVLVSSTDVALAKTTKNLMNPENFKRIKYIYKKKSNLFTLKILDNSSFKGTKQMEVRFHFSNMSRRMARNNFNERMLSDISTKSLGKA